MSPIPGFIKLTSFALASTPSWVLLPSDAWSNRGSRAPIASLAAAQYDDLDRFERPEVRPCWACGTGPSPRSVGSGCPGGACLMLQAAKRAGAASLHLMSSPASRNTGSIAVECHRACTVDDRARTGIHFCIRLCIRVMTWRPCTWRTYWSGGCRSAHQVGDWCPLFRSWGQSDHPRRQFGGPAVLSPRSAAEPGWLDVEPTTTIAHAERTPDWRGRPGDQAGAAKPDGAPL
jgi:hypothetical protein